MTCPPTKVDDFCAVKDPAEILDYGIDYTEIMEQTEPPDFIITSTWAVKTYSNGGDLTVGVDNFDGFLCTVGISDGGKLNTYHRLTNTVGCASGRKYVRTILIWIQAK
jgi:hypothetical protein